MHYAIWVHGDNFEDQLELYKETDTNYELHPLIDLPTDDELVLFRNIKDLIQKSLDPTWPPNGFTRWRTPITIVSEEMLYNRDGELSRSLIEMYNNHTNILLVADEAGNFKATTKVNNIGKWDYYAVGGRYANSLINKQGRPSDSERMRDIDWEVMESIHLDTPHVRLREAIYKAGFNRSNIKSSVDIARELHKQEGLSMGWDWLNPDSAEQIQRNKLNTRADDLFLQQEEFVKLRENSIIPEAIDHMDFHFAIWDELLSVSDPAEFDRLSRLESRCPYGHLVNGTWIDRDGNRTPVNPLPNDPATFADPLSTQEWIEKSEAVLSEAGPGDLITVIDTHS